MSDHFSGPAVMGDPSVDITDFFAFPSPERPGNLVLIMDVFPLATAQSFFSDVVTHRFRLRPLSRSGGSITHGAAEYTIDVTFSDVPEGSAVQKGYVVTSDGRRATFVVGTPLEHDGMRVFAGLVSDPFFMDVEAAIRTDISGKLSFDTAANTVEFRDVLAIVVEIPIAPIVDTIQWRDPDRRDLGDPRHAPRQPDPARTPRAARDQERRHGEPDSRSAHEGRRASRPLQPRRRVRALASLSATLRVTYSMRTWRFSTSWTATPRGRPGLTGAIRCAIF